MTIKLSRRQIKEADRVGGIELMLPWPAELPDPGILPDDSERPATPEERAWVERDIQPACQEVGLVAVRAQAVRTHGPHRDGSRQQTRLAVILIGQRWVGAKGSPPPRMMWVL